MINKGLRGLFIMSFLLLILKKCQIYKLKEPLVLILYLDYSNKLMFNLKQINNEYFNEIAN